MKTLLTILLFAFNLCSFPTLSVGGTFFQENFDDANFSSRGWYDGTGTGGSAIDTINKHDGTASFMCHFLQGATSCNGVDMPLRKSFGPSDSVYVSYWTKHSSNWVGAGVNRTYHPHIMFILTNLEGQYPGPAITHGTAYVEENQGFPQTSWQDGLNINMSYQALTDLTNITENRATGGCNGNQPAGQINNDCYDYMGRGWGSAGSYTNGNDWKNMTTSDYNNGNKVPYYDSSTKTSWHFQEAYFQMNTIANGKGQPDGIMQQWLDGVLITNVANMIYRTAQNPNQQFNQFMFSPYNEPGHGSPIDQTVWFDTLTVASSRPGVVSESVPSPPVNLRVP